MDPFLSQYTLAVLSDPVHMVRSVSSTVFEMTSWCAMLPQSSRSLLVIVPCLLEKDTSLFCTASLNGFLQR